MTQVEIDPKYFTKYIIPSYAKPSIRNDLMSLGIKHDFLPPDLDGIAKGIKHSMNWVLRVNHVDPSLISLRETPEKMIHENGFAKSNPENNLGKLVFGFLSLSCT